MINPNPTFAVKNMFGINYNGPPFNPKWYENCILGEPLGLLL